MAATRERAETAFHLAIDLGAGSGRGMLGSVSAAGLEVEEVHRFHYPPAFAAGRLRWPFEAALAGVKEALGAAGRAAERQGGRIETVGVDSWGVDYGLLDAGGRLVEDPVCYRDPALDGSIERVLREVPRAEIFQRTGVQIVQYNTLFQLHEQLRGGLPPGARRLLMIADLVHHSLCGSTTGEYTNATTTQLLDVRTRRWADDLFSRLSLPRELMPELATPGAELGGLRPALQKDLGLGSLRVVAPATHDTASAVAGTPLQPGWAFVSSGTWSLVGVEREGPLVSDAVAGANFTNEGGVGGTVRFLKNVMGLWILDSCRQEWVERGLAVELDDLLAAAAAIEVQPGLVYPDHPRFFHPRNMTAEVQAALAETGQKVPDDPARLTRVVLDSLALRYASLLSTIEALTGEPISGVHIVGGGCRNQYLNQATADAFGRPVLAGPVEAAASGSLLVQAVASSHIESLARGRELVARVVRPRRYEPRRRHGWESVAERYREIEARYG